MNVRDRLTAYAREHGRSERRRDLLVEVAAGKVHETLEYLSFGVEEAAAAQADYLTALRRRRTSGLPPSDAERKTYWWLLYRIDTFYVFLGVLLDDIASMVSRAIGRDVPESHAGLVSTLSAAAEARGLTGHEVVVAAAESLTPHKDFRDDYVVHRGRNKPRVARSLTWTQGETLVRINVGGIAYPKEGEEIELVVSEDPAVLLSALEDYLSVVLELIEPLRP